MHETVVVPGAIRDGVEWFTVRFPDGREEEDCQCARCGSSCVWVNCWNCGGEGEVQRYDDMTLGGLIEEYETCHHCRGTGGWHVCCSSPEWCEANPLPDRAHIKSTATSALDDA